MWASCRLPAEVRQTTSSSCIGRLQAPAVFAEWDHPATSRVPSRPPPPRPASGGPGGRARRLLVWLDKHGLDLGEAHGDLDAAGQLPEPDRVLLLVPAKLPEGLEQGVTLQVDLL